MVEKIIISPESIRGLGNIVMPKNGADFEEYNCTMEVSEDTVNGETVTVYVLTPETTTISLVLSSNVSTVTAGSNVILSVTVTEDEVPVSGQSVSFKLGGTELGTSTTNSSGVATYTYTTTIGGSLNFSADYAGHSSNGVSVVVNKRSTSTSLSLGSASIIVGGSTTASATVTSTGSGVSGLTVTFKDGTTSLGTATTNSSGVATYTLSGLSVGSHSITAVVTATDTYETSTSSASTLTVLDHSYSLAFSAASYPASSGSATLELTLLDNSVPVSGATVSVTGSDSSSYSCITNSSGVGTVTVSNVSSETTFTATFGSVSDTCTVTVHSYLFYDACDSSSGLSQYGTSVLVRGSNAVATLEYDSTENCYALYGQGNYHAMVPIPALNDEDQYSIEMEIKMASSQYRIAGFYLDNRNDTTSYGMDMSLAVYDRCIHSRQYKVSSDGSEQNSSTSNQITADTWYRLRMTVNGSSLTGTLYNLEGTQIVTITKSLSVSNKQMGLFVFCEKGTSGSRVYIRNIKAESLLFYDDCSSSSRLSEYGNYVSLFGTSGNGTITYNNTENAYSIAKTNNRDAFTGFKLPISATDKIKITCKVKLTSTSAYNQFGIGVQESTSKYEFIRIRGDKYLDGFKNNTNSSIGSNTNVASFNSAYYYLEISYDGSSRVARVYDNSMSLVKEWNLSSVQSYDTPSFYLAINTNSTAVYIKEIKVEAL